MSTKGLISRDRGCMHTITIKESSGDLSVSIPREGTRGDVRT